MIKIISGTYGLRKDGRVVPKNSKSEPFETDPAEEKRLIDLGIAEEVKVDVTIPALEHVPEPEEENTSINFEDMSVKQIREYAKEKDIEIPKSATKKADIVAIIMSAESESDDEKTNGEAEQGNDMPNIKAQMPE
ncbi:MAG: hypothetical protein J1E81_07425 [Eubacterium sp.]|nr:hypothetical protein [Eubacterium sp.]